MNNEKTEQLSLLAREVLTLSRNHILVNLRFLDKALILLEPMEKPELLYATDGQYLAYDSIDSAKRRNLKTSNTMRPDSLS